MYEQYLVHNSSNLWNKFTCCSGLECDHLSLSLTYCVFVLCFYNYFFLLFQSSSKEKVVKVCNDVYVMGSSMPDGLVSSVCEALGTRPNETKKASDYFSFNQYMCLHFEGMFLCTAHFKTWEGRSISICFNLHFLC